MVLSGSCPSSLGLETFLKKKIDFPFCEQGEQAELDPEVVGGGPCSYAVASPFHSVGHMLLALVPSGSNIWVPSGVQGMAGALGWCGILGGSKKEAVKEARNHLALLLSLADQVEGSPQSTSPNLARTTG